MTPQETVSSREPAAHVGVMSATHLIDGQGAHHAKDGKYTVKPLDEADGVALEADMAGPVEAEPVRVYADAPQVFTAKYESVEEKVAAYTGELDKAFASLDNDEDWLNYLDFASKFHRYSPNNQLLIALQTDGRATHVAGFRAWDEKWGRQVRKGEKAIGILAPKAITLTEKDPSGNPVMGPDGKPKKRRAVVGFTTAAVFDIAQTDGPEVPTSGYETQHADVPPDGFMADMEAAAAEAGYTVEYRDMDSHAAGTAQGWTDPRGKSIVIDSSQSPGSQANTLAHELGHVYAGHCEPDQAGKYHVGQGGCRGQMETEAESIAYVLTRANGMSDVNVRSSAVYAKSWARGDKDAVRSAAENVSKATKKVLYSTKFRNATYEEGHVPGEEKAYVPRKRPAKKTAARKTAAKKTVRKRAAAQPSMAGAGA